MEDFGDVGASKRMKNFLLEDNGFHASKQKEFSFFVEMLEKNFLKNFVLRMFRMFIIFIFKNMYDVIKVTFDTRKGDF